MLVGLNEDQVVPWDWSNALPGPQPIGVPVSSLAVPTSAPPPTEPQSRVIRTLCVVAASGAIATLRTSSGS